MDSSNKAQTFDRKYLWIHCFNCSEFYVLKRKKLFLLECKHISCEKCLRKVDDLRVICPTCKKPARYFVINNEMPASVKKFFNPRPYSNKMSMDWNVIGFQQSCHRRLIHRLLAVRRLKQQQEYLLSKRAQQLKQLHDFHKTIRKERMRLEFLAKKTSLYLRRANESSRLHDFTRSSGYRSFNSTLN